MEDNDKKLSDDNYEFVTETIKRRPINVRRIVKRIFITIILGVIFGIATCATLLATYPILKERLYPQEDTKPVSLPVTMEEIEQEPVEEFVPPSEDTVPSSTEEVKEEKPTDVNNEEADTVVEEDEEKDNQEVVINQVVERVEKSLELEDYSMLLRKISSIADTAQKSMVTVSAKSSNTDWFNNSFENNNSSTGLIVADNGKELLIVAPTEIFHNATFVDVTFCDGNTYSASVRKSDANTGLSIVAVNLSRIEEDTMERIEMAQFGSISSSAVGIPVVVIGSPYGTAGSVAIGQITSNSTVIDKTDSSVGIISTDIYGSPKASGVVVNYNGRIVGIVCHESAFSDMPNLIRAYSIADLTDSIEKISNGQNIACLGIIGTDVTKDANENYKVPMGAYVKEVVSDSPAMNVGIRNGDVIVKIGTEDIKSFEDYKNVILEYQPDDIINITLQRPTADTYTEVTYEVTLEALK